MLSGTIREIYFYEYIINFRQAYKHMQAEREKGKSKTGKGEIFTSEHLQSTKEDYENEVTLLVFSLKSLKQEQFRSLLTQVAHHYTAQVYNYNACTLPSLYLFNFQEINLWCLSHQFFPFLNGTIAFI